MTNRQIATVAMGVGLDPSNVDVVVFNRSGAALARGDVVVFALGLSSVITSDGLTISTDPGSSASVFASVTKFNTNTLRPMEISGVVQQGGADLAQCVVRVRGITSAYVYNRANASVGVGEHLTLGFAADSKGGYYEGGNTSTTVVQAGDSAKIHGFTLEAVSGTTSDGALTKVWIDGINGFGGLN